MDTVDSVESVDLLDYAQLHMQYLVVFILGDSESVAILLAIINKSLCNLCKNNNVTFKFNVYCVMKL